ncbi:LOW QUALITY PROTEIN: Calcium homeostasis modulator protein 6, partial [Galemys pyrenaicus]
LEHGSKWAYSLVTLLTAGGESIFSAAVFQCPCDPTWNVPYGLVFLLVPALVLLLLGYWLNARTCTWRRMTSCCLRQGSQLRTTGSQCCWVGDGYVLVAPLSWVAVALLGGTYYECFASRITSLVRKMCLGRKENCLTTMPKLPCLRDEEPDLQDLLKELQAQSQKFTTVLRLLSTEHGSKLAYSLVTLLTAGGESIFSGVVFQCPCDRTWNVPYGMVFLLVPALVLLLLGYWLNARTFTYFLKNCLETCKKNCPMTYCCCSRPDSQSCSKERKSSSVSLDKSCPKERKSSSVSGDKSCTKGFKCCCVSVDIGIVLVAPLSWLAVALLGGTYYECFASGFVPLARMACHSLKVNCSTPMYNLPCLQDKQPDLLDLLKELKSQSQVAGWTLIAVVVIVIMICKCYTLWKSPVAFTQQEFGDIYRNQEQKIFTVEATKNAMELANRNVKCFFEGSPPGHTGPTTQDWEQISPPDTFRPDKQYYSALHKYFSPREVAGWTLIAVVVIIIMICKCYTLWNSTDFVTRVEFREIYRHQERKIFREEATKNAIKLASGNVKCFFEGSPPGHNGPTKEEWEKILPQDTSISEEMDIYYSRLHRYVSISKEDRDDMKRFPNVLKLLKLKHGSKWAYSLVTLLTAGGESIFSGTVFQCPCDPTWNVPYGLVFLLVPAL